MDGMPSRWPGRIPRYSKAHRRLFRWSRASWDGSGRCHELYATNGMAHHGLGKSMFCFSMNNIEIFQNHDTSHDNLENIWKYEVSGILVSGILVSGIFMNFRWFNGLASPTVTNGHQGSSWWWSSRMLLLATPSLQLCKSLGHHGLPTAAVMKRNMSLLSHPALTFHDTWWICLWLTSKMIYIYIYR